MSSLLVYMMKRSRLLVLALVVALCVLAVTVMTPAYAHAGAKYSYETYAESFSALSDVIIDRGKFTESNLVSATVNPSYGSNFKIGTMTSQPVGFGEYNCVGKKALLYTGPVDGTEYGVAVNDWIARFKYADPSFLTPDGEQFDVVIEIDYFQAPHPYSPYNAANRAVFLLDGLWLCADPTLAVYNDASIPCGYAAMTYINLHVTLVKHDTSSVMNVNSALYFTDIDMPGFNRTTHTAGYGEQCTESVVFWSDYDVYLKKTGSTIVKENLTYRASEGDDNTYKSGLVVGFSNGEIRLGWRGTACYTQLGIGAYSVTANPVANVKLTVKKSLIGRSLKANEFSFALKDTRTGRTVATASNDDSGNVTFSLTYNDILDIGLHKYTVTEMSGSLPSVTYDTHSANFDVRVTGENNTDGQTVALDATVKNTSGSTTFTNTYKAKPVSIAIDVEKAFRVKLAQGQTSNRTLKANEFSFTLTPGAGAPGSTQTKTNAANGTVTFNAISFTDAGTYTYTVRETAGSDSQIKYDSHTDAVTVTVTDDSTGQLKATVAHSGKTFTNEYEPRGFVTGGAKRASDIGVSTL